MYAALVHGGTNESKSRFTKGQRSKPTDTKMTEPFINTNRELVIEPERKLTISIDNVSRGDLPDYWEKEYINQKIATVPNHKHKMLLQFLWMTGVRITEAISITKGCLDFENYTVTIKWQKNRRWNSRNIPLYPNLKDMLQIYTATMTYEEKVFPMTRQMAFKMCKQYMGGSPHKFRHSFAVNWLRQGGKLTTLSQMLGHSDIKTTMIYTKLVPRDIGRELQSINFG